MDYLDKAYTVNKDAFGRVRIWSVNPEGSRELILEQQNTIVLGGADITAKALSGLPNTGITHMYVANDNVGAIPTVTVNDTVTSFGSTFTRIPLTFSPNYSNEAGYTSNLVYFSVYITGSTIPNGNFITSLGLVNASVPSSSSGDNLFSRIAFSPITYNSTQGLVITWGLTFRAS